MRYLLIILLLLSCSSPVYKKIIPVPGKVSFCVVGDVGNASSSQRKVAKAMEKSGCQKLVILGDLIYPSGIISATDPVLEERFTKPYENFQSIYLVLGNHDYVGNPGAWKELARIDKRIVHPASYFYEKINDICLFFLDTNFQSPVTNLFEEESKWLADNMSGCAYKVAFTHHPYSNSGRNGHARGEVKLFYEKLIIGNFQMVFSGHEHIIRDEGMSGITHQYLSGAGGKHVPGHRPGYIVLTLDVDEPSKSEVELRPL